MNPDFFHSMHQRPFMPPIFHVEHADCIEAMKQLAVDSIDSIVTDPPYGLSFMGKDWDHGIPGVPFWAEALRVAKPGAHLLAFGGTRTFHRLAVAIEDAGWEIRDCVMWVYGSGFPKSHNLKGEREGWGTCLKPAWEPIIVARKPLVGTVAANVEQFGTGAINIDGCRVETTDNLNGGGYSGGESKGMWTPGKNGGGLGRLPGQFEQPEGRWPANLVHDGSEEVTGLMPDAARFFYCSKTSKKDRDDGLNEMPTVTADPYAQHRGRRMEDNDTRIDGKPPAQGKNHHPTVKPTDLMRYLCRLVTPPGGVVLDPFCGSGSTGKAAILEGFNFLGIEKEAQYVEIARKRIEAAATK